MEALYRAWASRATLDPATLDLSRVIEHRRSMARNRSLLCQFQRQLRTPQWSEALSRHRFLFTRAVDGE